MDSAEAQLTSVSSQISDVETLSTSVGSTSTADTSLTSVCGNSAADASFASASDNSASVGTRLASADREPAVASRYRFGGSLRGNDDEPSGWTSLAEATHFGEPSSAQLVDATSVSRRQCGRVVLTC